MFLEKERGFMLSNPSYEAPYTKVLAYGLATALRQLESSGAMQEVVARRRLVEAQARLQQERERERQKKEERQQQIELAQRQIAQTLQQSQTTSGQMSPYRIIKLKREGNSDFMYVFTLVLNGEPSIQTFFGIQKLFANELLDAYKLEYPNADVSSLRIAVQPELIEGRIQGRAAVLTIIPVSLAYDSNTRRGKLSVRYNANQFVEARAWIRKNVETLARDKNIALTTGQLPPEATCYSLGERVEGNVMEIEFKTE